MTNLLFIHDFSKGRIQILKDWSEMTALKVEKKKLQQWFKKGLKMYLASQVHVFVLYLVVNSVSNRDNLFI